MSRGRSLLLLLVINGFIKSQGQAPRAGLPISVPLSMGMLDMDVNPVFAAAALAGVGPGDMKPPTPAVGSFSDIRKTAPPSGFDLVANEQDILRQGVAGGVSVDMSGFLPPPYIPSGVTVPTSTNTIARSSVLDRLPKRGSLPIVAIDERELGLSKDGKFLTMREQYTPEGSVGHSNTIEIPRGPAFSAAGIGGTSGWNANSVAINDLSGSNEQGPATTITAPSNIDAFAVNPTGIPSHPVADAHTGQSLPDVHPTFAFPQGGASVAGKPARIEKRPSFVPVFAFQPAANELSKPSIGSSLHDSIIPPPLFGNSVDVSRVDMPGRLSVSESTGTDSGVFVGDRASGTHMKDTAPEPTIHISMSVSRTTTSGVPNNQIHGTQPGIHFASPSIREGVASGVSATSNVGTSESQSTAIDSAFGTITNTDTAAQTSVSAEGPVHVDATEGIPRDIAGGVAIGGLVIDRQHGVNFDYTEGGSIIAATNIDTKRTTNVDATGSVQEGGMIGDASGGISIGGLAIARPSGLTVGTIDGQPTNSMVDSASNLPIDTAGWNSLYVAGDMSVVNEQGVPTNVGIAPLVNSVGGISLNARFTDSPGSFARATSRRDRIASNANIDMTGAIGVQERGGMLTNMADVSGMDISGDLYRMSETGAAVMPEAIHINTLGSATDTNVMNTNAAGGSLDTVGSMTMDQSGGFRVQTLADPRFDSSAGIAFESTGVASISAGGLKDTGSHETTMLQDRISPGGTDIGGLVIGRPVGGIKPSSPDTSIVNIDHGTIDTFSPVGLDMSVPIPAGGEPALRDHTIIGNEGFAVFAEPGGTSGGAILSAESITSDTVAPVDSNVALSTIYTSDGASLTGDSAVGTEIAGGSAVPVDTSRITGTGVGSGGFGMFGDLGMVDSTASSSGEAAANIGGVAIGSFGFDTGLSKPLTGSSIQGDAVAGTSNFVVVDAPGSASFDMASNTAENVFTGEAIGTSPDVTVDASVGVSTGISDGIPTFVGGIALPATFGGSLGLPTDLPDTISVIDTSRETAETSGVPGFQMSNSISNKPSGLPMDTMSTMDIGISKSASGTDSTGFDAVNIMSETPSAAVVDSFGSRTAQFQTHYIIPIVATGSVTGDTKLPVDTTHNTASMSTVGGSVIATDATAYIENAGMSAESPVFTSDFPTTSINDMGLTDQALIDTNNVISAAADPTGTPRDDIALIAGTAIDTRTGLTDGGAPFDINTSMFPDTPVGDITMADSSVGNINTGITGVEQHGFDTAGTSPDDIAVIAGTAIDAHTGKTDGGATFDTNIHTTNTADVTKSTTGIVDTSVVMTRSDAAIGDAIRTDATTSNMAAFGSRRTEASKTEGPVPTDIPSSRSTDTTMPDTSNNMAYILPGRSIFSGVSVDNFGGIGARPSVGVSVTTREQGPRYDMNIPTSRMTGPMLPAPNAFSGFVQSGLAVDASRNVSPTFANAPAPLNEIVDSANMKANTAFTLGNTGRTNSQTGDQSNMSPPPSGKVFEVGKKIVIDTSSGMPGMHTFATSNDFTNNVSPTYAPAYKSNIANQPVVVANSFRTDMFGTNMQLLEPRIGGAIGSPSFATNTGFNSQNQPIISRQPSVDFISSFFNQPIGQLSRTSPRTFEYVSAIPVRRSTGISTFSGPGTPITAGGIIQTTPDVGRNNYEQYNTQTANSAGMTDVQSSVASSGSRADWGITMGQEAGTISKTADAFVSISNPAMANQVEWSHFLQGQTDVPQPTAPVPEMANQVEWSHFLQGQTDVPQPIAPVPEMANQVEWSHFLQGQTDVPQPIAPVPEITAAEHLPSQAHDPAVSNLISDPYTSEIQHVLSTSEIRTGSASSPANINVDLSNKGTGVQELGSKATSTKPFIGLTDPEIYRFAQMLRQWSNSQVAANDATVGTVATLGSPASVPSVPPFIAPGMAGGSAVTVQLRRKAPAVQSGMRAKTPSLPSVTRFGRVRVDIGGNQQAGIGIQRTFGGAQGTGSGSQRMAFALGTGAVLPNSVTGVQGGTVRLQGASGTSTSTRTGTPGSGGIKVTGVKGISVRFHDDPASQVNDKLAILRLRGLLPAVEVNANAQATSPGTSSGTAIRKSLFTRGTPMESFGRVQGASISGSRTGSSGSMRVATIGSTTFETAPPAIIPGVSQAGVPTTQSAANLGQKLGAQFRAGLLPIGAVPLVGAMQKQISLPKPYAKQTCTMEADPASIYHFYITLGKEKFHLKCAYGTAFDTKTCDCSKIILTHGEDCLEVNLDFTTSNNNNEVVDTTINRLPINNQNVDITNSSSPFPRIAVFGGDGKLTVWRYVNYDFRDHVMLKLKFRPGIGGDRFQPLIANCDGGPEGPSVGIIFDSEKNEIIMMLQTVTGTDKSLTFKINPNTWSDVTYIYDETYFAGVVNGIQQVLPAEGLVQIRGAALIMGKCPRFGGFNGGMDNVQIYTCVPPQLKLRV